MSFEAPGLETRDAETCLATGDSLQPSVTTGSCQSETWTTARHLIGCDFLTLRASDTSVLSPTSRRSV